MNSKCDQRKPKIYQILNEVFQNIDSYWLQLIFENNLIKTESKILHALICIDFDWFFIMINLKYIQILYNFDLHWLWLILQGNSVEIESKSTLALIFLDFKWFFKLIQFKQAENQLTNRKTISWIME